MKIHRIVFENFRSFRDKTELDNIKPISVFVGQNNAGKSNVIEVLNLLRSMTTGGWSKPYDEIVFDKNGKSIQIEIDVELNEEERRKIFDLIPHFGPLAGQINFDTDNIFRYVKYKVQIGRVRCLIEELFITDQNNTFVPIIHHQWTQTNNNAIETLVANFNGLGNAPVLNQISGLRPVIKNQSNSTSFGFFNPMSNPQEPAYKIASMLIPFFQNLRIFNAYRKAAVKVGGTEQPKMLEDGSNVVGVMTTIIGSDTDEFARIMGIYKKIVGGIKTVNVPLVGNEHTVRIKEDGLNSQIDFANMSAGLHQALILVFAIENADKNQTICIEEPEISLHASAQKRLYQYIHEHCKKNQFFITTHSSVFASIGDDVSTYLLTKYKGNTKIMPIDKEKDLKFVKQQLGIRNSDVYSNDYVIFVEGDSEEYAFPIVAAGIGFDNVGVEIGRKIRIVNLDGNGIIPKLGQFLDYLKASDTEAFIIADGDKKVHNAISDYIREDLVKEDHTKVWEKEFEDTFESERIIDAMKKLAIKNRFVFDMQSTYLDTERGSGKKVADILQKYLHDKEQPDLDKPDLAQQLAHDIVSEIKSGMSRTETQFELEVKRIKMVIEANERVI